MKPESFINDTEWRMPSKASNDGQILLRFICKALRENWENCIFYKLLTTLICTSFRDSWWVDAYPVIQCNKWIKEIQHSIPGDINSAYYVVPSMVSKCLTIGNYFRMATSISVISGFCQLHMNNLISKSPFCS